jgi:hypothetical protein
MASGHSMERNPGKQFHCDPTTFPFQAKKKSYNAEW